jgi:hypothetical protein
LSRPINRSLSKSWTHGRGDKPKSVVGRDGARPFVRVDCVPFCSNDVTLLTFNERPKAFLSGRVFVLLLANERDFFALNHSAIDGHFSNIFTAGYIIHDVEHHSLEHRA